jgi:hypothetical protein
MDVSGGVFMQWHTLEKNVVIVCTLGNLAEVNNLVDNFLYFEGVWVHLLADFTFEALPIKRPNVHIHQTWLFFLLLSQHPILKALEVDQTDCTFAFARQNQRI